MAATFDIRIRADKSGPAPEPGEAWPVAGVEILGDLPDEISIPTSFVQRHLNAGWLEVVGAGWVERPSRDNPDEGDDGSAAVAGPHRLTVVGQPPPHAFMHVERLIFDTLNHGRVEYVVTHQPDKYVDSDDPTEQVTLKHYNAGNTRVDHFYTCVREG